MHLDIWSPGTISNDSGKSISLITTMCNLILFVIPFLLDQFTLQSVDTTFIEFVVCNFVSVGFSLLTPIANSADSLDKNYKH